MLNLLLLNAVARSDRVDREGPMILLSKAAGGRNELGIISHVGFRVISVLLQDR